MYANCASQRDDFSKNNCAFLFNARKNMKHDNVYNTQSCFYLIFMLIRMID